MSMTWTRRPLGNDLSQNAGLNKLGPWSFQFLNVNKYQQDNHLNYWESFERETRSSTLNCTYMHIFLRVRPSTKYCRCLHYNRHFDYYADLQIWRVRFCEGETGRERDDVEIEMSRLSSLLTCLLAVFFSNVAVLVYVHGIAKVKHNITYFRYTTAIKMHYVS